MSVIGIDIGSSTTKVIEYKSQKLFSKAIYSNNEVSIINAIDKFIAKNEISNIEKFVLTGINAKKVDIKKYNVPVTIVDEFIAIGVGGLSLGQKREALIASIGTGTALIKAEKGKEFKHLGGTGVGGGTLTNLCNRFADTKSFEEILELSSKGNLSNIDLRIEDLTNEDIKTLPPDLTLANFGKLNEKANKEDIVVGVVNMVFETIGMMAAFATINDNIKDIVLIGNIVCIPVVKDILSKIEKTHGLSFIIPKDAQYAVAIGAILHVGCT